MADKNVENDVVEVPQLDETLEVLLLQTLEEAQQRMEDGEDLPPFTATLIDESVFEESHTGSTDECFESARETVEGAQGARAYAFCYDGFVETDDDNKDAIIAEGGVAGEEEGVVLGLLYAEGEEGIEFEEEVCYIAATRNFLADKEPVSDIAEDEE